MAGMLPGVEAARRRRFSQTRNSNHGGNSSLCLYERNHGFHISSSYLMRSSIGSQEECDQSLDTVAREAKKRLDERLNSAHLKSDIKRDCNCVIYYDKLKFKQESLDSGLYNAKKEQGTYSRMEKRKSVVAEEDTLILEML
ncbi:uncharacterized protein [Primulina huaijiensis]|uniref:uncharacterized protein isoform X1 n=1 Tax=Primulina huaijiensis TaxID=1492673 RepID=UPI003CC78629